MTRQSLFLLIAVLNVLQLAAQTNNFSTYYNQRYSLFESMPDTPDEIIMLGNSITDGCDWSELFQDPRVKNRGISGDVTEGILYRLGEVTRSKPAKVFLLIGINDLSRNIPADTVFRNICNIAAEIRKESTSTLVFVQSILPVNPAFGRFPNHGDKTPEVLEVNNKLEKWCEANGFRFIDLFHTFTEPGTDYLNPDFTNDGLHLTAKGYLKWAEIIAPLIRQD